MLARDEVILGLEREIECLPGLIILRELQMGIDEIMEGVDAILRRAPIGLRDLRGAVRRDFQRPSST